MKDEIKSQYHASLDMFQQAVENCPPMLWRRVEDKNQFWHVAYHAVFYSHFYLHVTEESYIPWPKHRAEMISLSPDDAPGEVQPYTQAEILEFIEYLRERIDPMVDALEMGAPSGFSWLPFNKLELQFYNIRHLMQHTGELAERLWAEAGVEVGWVGRGSA
ncbi:MAG TPA: DinB family protein [Anaerolineales bacterium]|nr:DinB family protein [Anaerolineales bacterium]